MWARKTRTCAVFDIIMHSDWGTSYNAYLVKGSEKLPFETSKLEFFRRISGKRARSVHDPASIDYIVVITPNPITRQPGKTAGAGAKRH